ncbi:MAG: hypothetical protein IPP83_08480 [Flavobacteriales bacterium]|nr:hypothetical protein [Flavobacteriales bacterium]
MRSTTLFTALVALLLSSCGSEPKPQEEVKDTPPPAGMKAYAGLLGYDGIQVILTDCEKHQVYLREALFTPLIDNIRAFKLDPQYTLWVQVEVPADARLEMEKDVPVLTKGRIVSTKVGSPC